MYLIWFEQPSGQATTKEFVMLFRGGRRSVKSGAPGLLLEAVQHSGWDSGPSESKFRRDWASGDPKWTLPRERGVFSPGKMRGRIVGAPWWTYKPRESGLKSKDPLELRSILQNIVSVLLARHGEMGPWPQQLPSDGRKAFQRTAPSERYDLIRDMIDTRGHPPYEGSPAPKLSGSHYWTVIERAYSNYHPFPRMWLRSVRAAPFCFHAVNHWEGALLEIAWAVEHDVWARQCRHPECDVWFLESGRQGRRREFCEVHRRVGPPSRYRISLRTRYPKWFAVRKQRRNLAAKRRRDSISAEEFARQDTPLRDREQWYRDVGEGPKRRSAKSI